MFWMLSTENPTKTSFRNSSTCANRICYLTVCAESGEAHTIARDSPSLHGVAKPSQRTNAKALAQERGPNKHRWVRHYGKIRYALTSTWRTNLCLVNLLGSKPSKDNRDP